MDHRSKAVSYAQHYFSLIATKAGIRWDSDNDAEIEMFVEHIIEAAKAELKDTDDITDGADDMMQTYRRAKEQHAIFIERNQAPD